MTPADFAVIPQPEPLPLPAPAWLLWSLLMLTLTLHVIAMNLLVGGSVIALYVRLRHAANVHARELLARLARPMPAVIAATVTLGVAPLLFVQVLYGRLFFVSSVLMAWIWLAVVPLLIGVYYGTYAVALRAAKGKIASAGAYAGIVVGLAAIAFIYTTNMTLMLRADRFASMYLTSGGGLHLNLGDPSLWPRWIHMLLGGIAVAGLAVMLIGVARAKLQPDFAGWTYRLGGAWSASATGANLIVGLWWLAALPWATTQRFLGGEPVATVLLGIGIVLGLATFALLLITLQRLPATGMLAVSLATMLVTIVTMLFVRDAVRQAALDRIHFAPVGWVQPQWGPFGVFAALLVIALGTVGWMAVALVRGGAHEEAAEPAAVAKAS